MSLIEKVILISIGLIPFIALIMFLPKILKNKKANKTIASAEPANEPKTTPTEIQPKQQTPKEKEKKQEFDDFSDYANMKKSKVSAPKRNFPQPKYDDFIERYVPPRQINIIKKEKTIREELDSLSPQLKALIISGALDRKNFDD